MLAPRTSALVRVSLALILVVMTLPLPVSAQDAACPKVTNPVAVPAGTVTAPGGAVLEGPGYYYTKSNHEALVCRLKARSSTAGLEMAKAELQTCRADRDKALQEANKMLGECETSLTGVVAAGEELRKAQVELGQASTNLKTEAEKTIEVLNKLETDGESLLKAGDGLLEAQQALLESNRNLAAAVEKTPTQGMVITGAIIIAVLAFGGGYAIGSL